MSPGGTPLEARGPLLEARELAKTWRGSRGRWGPERAEARALAGASFTIRRGEVLALVGGSGSGKSTAARGILRLLELDGGSVLYHPEAGPPVDLLRLPRARLRPLRRELAIVFQDPYASLDPRMRVGAIVAEGLRAHGLARGAGLEARAAELLARVGLPADALRRYPHAFSGGQRQRIAIARALATGPRLLVCDEALSALDASVQAQILALFEELRRELGLAFLFIAHDLALVQHFADRVAVMEAGRVVECAPTAELFAQPVQACTRELLAAMPRLPAAAGAGAQGSSRP